MTEKSRLKYLMPFIRRATYQINHHGPEDSCVVYRGIDLNEDQLEFFRPGRVFRFPGFTSTTTSRRVARGFGETLFKIQVSSDILQARNVTEISCYPAEEEWLFVPYSRFQVIRSHLGKVTLRAVDNLGDESDSATSSDDSSDTEDTD